MDRFHFRKLTFAAGWDKVKEIKPKEISERDWPTDYKEWKKGTTSGFVFPRCSVYAIGNFIYI